MKFSQKYNSGIVAIAALVTSAPSWAQTYPAKPVRLIVPFAEGDAPGLVSRRPVRGKGARAAGFYKVAAVMPSDYPSKPVRLIVPFAPGGGSDIIARILAPHAAALLGQQFIIDNRPGAGTIIGAEIAAKAPPDGYTLFLGITGTMAINPSIYRKLPYDPVRDFAAIGMVGTGPNVLVVHPALSAHSIKELIAIAKSHPGKLSYASAGTGGAPHLAGELFKSMAGVDMVHIPYKGAAPATVDLLAGQVQVMFAGMGAALPFIKSNRLRALGVAGAKRSRALPAVPAIGEVLKGFEASTWFALFAPAGTPQLLIAQLNTTFMKAVALPDVERQMADQGYEPQTGTPDELKAYVASEIAKWAKVIRDARIPQEGG
jgi:tripartite-type tricarboxylate transporter receptor subunit TctC